MCTESNRKETPIMDNIKTIIAAVATLVSSAAGYCPSSGAFDDDFSTDPLGGGSSWTLVGPNTSALADGTAVPVFQWSAGTLTVNYNSLHPTSRLVAPLDVTVTGADTFEFGATCTLRSDNYDPDPLGYSGIMTFALMNSSTTGTDRSGDFDDWAADTYDNVEMTFFPNVSEFFGGPYVAPTVFGGNSGSDNAFFNVTFGSDETSLPLDAPLHITLEHDAGSRQIVCNVQLDDGSYVVHNLVVDVDGLDPSFQADSFGVSMYHDGWATAPTPSVVATVEFAHVFFRNIRSGKAGPIEGAPSASVVALCAAAIAVAVVGARGVAVCRRIRLQ